MKKGMIKSAKRLRRRAVSEDVLWELAAAGAAAIAAIAVRNVLERGWKSTTRKRPPDNPAADGVSWNQALAWGAASGLAAGVARIAGQRGAAAGWKRVTGKQPRRLRKKSK